MKKILLIFIIVTIGIVSVLFGLKVWEESSRVSAINTTFVNQIEKAQELKDYAEELAKAEEEELERIEVEKKTLILEYDTKFELPLENSMGISITNMNVKEKASTSSATVTSVKTNELFLIKEESESGEWLLIETTSGKQGYVESIKTLINLPDIIPSIQYNLVNSDAAIFRTSGYPLPNITGLKKYDYYHYNPRLDKNEYIAVVMYPMAEKIQGAQALALADGNTLVIYESYRPYTLQKEVVNELDGLMTESAEIAANIETTPWSKGWFISQGLSNHQRALAIDVSLAKIEETERVEMGNVQYNYIIKYTEYSMQTPMHELSIDSTSLKSPVSSTSKTAWKSAVTSEAMTTGAIKMREYFDENDLSPIASEWWHFNDLDNITKAKSTGVNFAISLKFDECISKVFTYEEEIEGQVE